MSTATLRYYSTTVSFMPEQYKRRVQHARTMLRLKTSRRKFKQTVRSLIAKIVY